MTPAAPFVKLFAGLRALNMKRPVGTPSFASMLRETNGARCNGACAPRNAAEAVSAMPSVEPARNWLRAIDTVRPGTGLASLVNTLKAQTVRSSPL